MSVFKHKGRWCVEITTKDITSSGAPRRRRRYVQTKAEAQRLEREMITKRDSGHPLPARGLTVHQYLVAWLERVESSDLKHSTKKSYANLTKSVLIPHLGRIKLVDLHQRDVDAMLRKAGETYSANTVRLIRTTLSVALTEALRDDLVGRNVAQLARPVRGARRKPLRVKIEDLQEIYMEADKHHLGDAIHLMATTGIRRGEACALTWADVHFGDAITYVTINKGVAVTDTGFAITTTKTEESNRILVLKEDVADRLRRRRDKHLQLVGPDKIDEAFVFGENPMVLPRPDTMTSTITKITARAGFAGVGPHQFRHLFTSSIMAKSDNVAALSKYLGHSNIRTTIDIYGHSTLQMVHEMKELVENTFPTSNPPEKSETET